MAWSYTGDPSSSDRDAVRFLVGDTISTDPQLQDAEVDYLLSSEGSVYGAAVAAVRALIARFARLVDKSVGDLQLSYSQRLAAYESLLVRLSAARASKNVEPFAGGISAAGKRAIDLDADAVSPSFKRDQFSYPGTGDSDDLLDPFER